VKKKVATLEQEIQELKISQAKFQAEMTGEVKSIRRDISTIAQKLTDLVDMRDQVHDNEKDIQILQSDIKFMKKIVYTIGMAVVLAVIGALLRLVIIQ